MKCTAIVSVTVEVPIEGMSESWNMRTLQLDAKSQALRKTREVCAALGKVTRIQVTAVLTEGEEEAVRE